MSHRSKREVASPAPQPLAAGFPWLGAFPSSGEAMAAPTGWWTALRPMNGSFVSPYGAWMGVVPTPDGYSNQDMSTNSSKRPPGGFLNFLHNGMTSFPATQSDPIIEHSTSGSKVKTVIIVDDRDDVRTEKRLSWTLDEDVRLDIGLDEDMKKYMYIQAAASKRHEDFLVTQQRVSDAKVEAAKLRKETALLESCKALMSMDTSVMDEEMKAEHMLGLKILR